MIKLLKWIFDNFYILFCLLTLIVARGLQLPFIPILCVLVFMYFISVYPTIRWNSGAKHIIMLCVYVLFSIAIYISNGYPLDIYYRGLFNYGFPLVFFLIASNISHQERDVFYQRTIIALMFTYLVGVYLYIYPPSWYTAWKVSQLEGWLGDRTDSYINNYRYLTSFFSHSYFVGYTSFWALSYLLHKIYKSPKVSVVTYVSLIITMVVLLLAQQRVTFVLGFILILIYSWLEIKKGSLRISYFMAAVIMVASYYVIKHLDELSFLFDRYITVFDGSVLDDGRSSQWKSVYKNFDDIFIGEGFNIVGHEAREYGMHTIADGELFKTIYELGVVGAIIFYSFCVGTIVRALKHAKEYAVELPVVIGFVAMQYGASPFGMTNIIILYWFCAGIVWNKKIVTNKRLINE